jgi:polyferredoxin
MAENMETDEVQAAPPVRWKNRRRMAWLSLTSMIILTYLIIFTDLAPESKLHVLGDVITWFYFSMASVVGCYMGFTTYARVKGSG